MLHRPDLSHATPPAERPTSVGGRTLVSVVGSPIDAISWDETCAVITRWAERRESRYVCICNVHSVITAQQDPDFHDVIQQADMATPDGAPVAWMMRRLGYRDQMRINGPDLMFRYCAQAAQRDERIFLYGNTPETLETLQRRLLRAFPTLQIVGCYSPPFRALTPREDAEIVQRINDSGAGTVWVSLGCPKQERWMAAHRGQIHAVMVGVGAAFDYHAGTLQRAPLWMQRHGLEWLHRFWSEPRRLGRRYLLTNTMFLVQVIKQLLRR
jgi:N-acetylglucosaminyldiphosphoundecaprenol N-acetyl-beta-D-mannosaminyltransferase